jgi:hypothetical protein
VNARVVLLLLLLLLLMCLVPRLAWRRQNMVGTEKGRN